MNNKRFKFKRIAAIAGLALAASTVSAVSPADIVAPLTTAICSVFTAVKTVAGYAASLALAYAAGKWVVSGDDPGQRKQAKDILVHVFIGLIIAGMATTITLALTGMTGCSP